MVWIYSETDTRWIVSRQEGSYARGADGDGEVAADSSARVIYNYLTILQRNSSRREQGSRIDRNEADVWIGFTR